MTDRRDDLEAGVLSGESDLADVTIERRQLLRLAYRLLGSTADAEDVLQETYVRWYSLSPADRDAVMSPVAWLTTVASRISSTCSVPRAGDGNGTSGNGSQIPSLGAPVLSTDPLPQQCRTQLTTSAWTSRCTWLSSWSLTR